MLEHWLQDTLQELIKSLEEAKMSDFEELFPELTLETDDIIMELAIKKDYSQIRDLDKRKEEFIKDLHDFIDEFSQTPESREFMAYFD